MPTNEFNFKYKPSVNPPQSWEELTQMERYFEALSRSIYHSFDNVAPLSPEFERYTAMSDTLLPESLALLKARSKLCMTIHVPGGNINAAK